MFFAIACPRTPKWMARRPEALRPGGSSFPSPNLLKAVSRGIPLATALQNGWRGVPMPFVPAAAFSPLRTSSKRCRAEYRLPPHSKMDGAASRSPSSRRQLFSLSEPPQSGVARNTACHRTPKWLARRPDALRPGGNVLECGGKRYSARHRFSRLRHECRPLATASRARIGKSA